MSTVDLGRLTWLVVLLVIGVGGCGARTGLSFDGSAANDGTAVADADQIADAARDAAPHPDVEEGVSPRDGDVDHPTDGGDVDGTTDGDVESPPFVSTCEDPAEEAFELFGELEGTAVGHRYCRRSCSAVTYRSERVFSTACAFGTHGLVTFAGRLVEGQRLPDYAVLRMPAEGPLPLEIFCAGPESTLRGTARPLWFELDPLERVCTVEDPAGSLVLDVEPDSVGGFSGSIDGIDIAIHCDERGGSAGYLSCRNREGSPQAALFVWTDPEAPVVPVGPVPVEVALLLFRASEDDRYVASCTRWASFLERDGEDAAHAELDDMSSFHDCPSEGAVSHLAGAYLESP